MSEDRVKVEVAEHVAVVTLARPEKHNALDVAMFEAIAGACDRLGMNPGCGRSCCTERGRASVRVST